jgi:chemotaxis protein CheZ
MVVAVAEKAIEDQPQVYQRIGELTRQLHDALRELGYDKAVESAVSALPDTRQRLDYIARLTGQAAERALSNVEKGQLIQDEVQVQAAELHKRWDQLFARELTVEEFRDLAIASREFMSLVVKKTNETNSLLTDIMMAQDFHDLTGQVIQKVVGIAHNMEEKLLTILIEATPPEKRANVAADWLSGPVIDSKGRDDVVTSQAQVDDLLESLGF